MSRSHGRIKKKGFQIPGRGAGTRVIVSLGGGDVL